MTALLLFLLIFFYLRYEKARTLHAALQDLQDPPVYFSRESGFFEKGFVLKLGRNPDLPEMSRSATPSTETTPQRTASSTRTGST